MNTFNENIEKVTLVMGEKPVRVKRVYCIGPVINPSENTYYNIKLSNIFGNTSTSKILRDKDLLYINNNRGSYYYNKYCNNDFALDFSDVGLSSAERLFLQSNIHCLDRKKVILRLGGRNARTKIWVNGTMVYNGELFIIDQEFVLLELNKGDNFIFSECCRVDNSEKTLKFAISAGDLDYEIKAPTGQILKSFINDNIRDKIQVIQESWTIKKSTYEFRLIPRDFINLSRNKVLLITVKDNKGHIYMKFKTKLGEMIIFVCSELKSRVSDLSFLIFEIEYEVVTGERIKNKNIILINGVDQELKKIKKKYELISNSNLYQLTYEDKTYVEKLIRNIESIILSERRVKIRPALAPYAFKEEIEYIHEFLLYLEKGFHYKDFFRDNQIKKIYFKSKLDGLDEHINIRLPENYSKKRSYPLVLFIPNETYDEEAMLCFGLGEYDNVIIAELSCRGMTFGSYIGEAAFLEGFENILDLYRIDKDKIYIFGLCAGAYAAWVMAQAYPHLFTALITSNGGMYEKNLNNLSNIKIMNICTDLGEKLAKVFEIPAQLSDKNYKGLLFENISQDALSYILYNNRYVIKWLLKQKKTNFPAKIYYRTERIRHNETHWSKIIEMDEGERYSILEGELVDDSNIKISLQNIKKCSIRIPDTINIEDICLSINGTKHHIKHRSSKLYIEETDDRYFISQHEEKYMINSSVGMGVLDIYMDSLKIVIPSSYSSDKEKKLIKNTALTFSRPFSSGIVPEININYTISKDIDLNKDDLVHYNLILIGHVYNKLLLDFKKDLSIKFDEKGYQYKNNRYEGDYFVTFLQTNPYNKEKKVLYIYANNIELLRNVYTRKLIIPTYQNGIHPFLNSEAFLYDGITYYIIDVLGSDIRRG